MSLTLRYMQFGDIRQVGTIDVMCFDPPWSYESYAFEISESNVSHMVVLEEIAGDAQPETARRESFLARLRGKGRARLSTLDGAGTILGYGGLWKIEGEAHISTIAIDPAWRGKGYGEILLAGMFGKALQLKADFIVLEVRVSNSIAQSLYRKYGFSRVRRRKNYYRSDNEDAWDMRVALDRDTRHRFERLYTKLRLQHGFLDTYSRKPRPRG
ncbi:MAG: ribosomal protein S18-alanine N-acetyltransferase [Chloroflexi bacterium]|nr:ribosomal protein S18-alanine N-acetyltransferase [Chloroflexota bacterium]